MVIVRGRSSCSSSPFYEVYPLCLTANVTTTLTGLISSNTVNPWLSVLAYGLLLVTFVTQNLTLGQFCISLLVTQRPDLVRDFGLPVNVVHFQSN